MKKPTYPKFKEFRLSSRKFLNPKEGLAAIQTTVDIEFNSISASLEITDCNRKVSLDFYMYKSDQKELNNKLKKLDILENTIKEFKSNINLALKEIEKRKPTIEKYNKEKKEWQKATNKKPLTSLNDLDLDFYE